MFRNLLMTLAILLASFTLAFAQQGRLKGKVIDPDTKEPLPFVNIVLDKGGTQVGGASSDFDGNYDINPIPPGTYDLKATAVGYHDFKVTNIIIPANRITEYNIQMKSQAYNIDEVTIIEYSVPLISKDNTTSGQTITAEEISKLPNRSAEGVASSVGGVFSRDGEVGSIRGSREGAVYYIDGVRVIGSNSVPQGAIDQVDVILGGTPAMYGDAMGGIINMTTKGPSRTFGGGVEYEHSVDGYGHQRVGFSLQGPLIKGRGEDKNSSLLGFFIAGDYNRNKVGSISSTGYYTASEEWQKFIEQTPLRLSGIGNGTYQNASFTRKDDLVYSRKSTNTMNQNFSLSGNINIRLDQKANLNLTIGGSMYDTRGNDFSRGNMFFNSAKNYRYHELTYRGFFRFTHRFQADAESASLVRNFYYTIQGDYSHYQSQSGDPDLWDNVFQYGHLGKYITRKTPTFEKGTVDSVFYNGQYHTFENVNVLNNWDYDTLIDYTPSEFNPLLARYNENYMNLYRDYGARGYYDNFTNWQLGGALLNGDAPSYIYGLYAVPGTIQTGYGKYVSDQIALNFNMALTLGQGDASHEVKLGLQYEQRSTSSMSYNNGDYPTNYWTLMRDLANAHIEQLDMKNPYVVSYDGYVDTIMYNRLYDGKSQFQFDASLREAMGLRKNGLEYIMIDSYDFNDNSIYYYDSLGVMHKGVVNGGLNLSMFAPDELTRDGKFNVFYYGFDYDGKKHSLFGDRPTLDDFFNEVDANGNHTRPIGAWRPIYVAGYIQDKFAFRDLIFNIGVRADRFDANQSIPKDPFILFDHNLVGDVVTGSGNDRTIVLSDETIHVPSNIGDDYAVYVNKTDDINTVVGYRKGNVWYNANGAQISDPNVLDMGSGISPWLKNPKQQRVDINSFEDYTPQWSFMPRISFSFPISDEALFFAHYDVLTQRPSNLYMNPLVYYYFSDYAKTVNNPALKPQQTIDYELGFTQKVTNTSSLTISAYYREMRNMIQMYRYEGAYPKSYNSFENLDFGTVKGLTTEYDLRRTKNVRVRASYTLQFADMTGSSTTTAAALIAAHVPNLRSTFPTSEDRRHSFNLTVDYRYGSGKKYNGPTTQRENKAPIQWLANTGFSLTLDGGSGVPYTASRNTNSPYSSNNLLKGTYNGSRMPASFRLNLRVDRDFDFMVGKKEGKEGRAAFVNVYLQVLNLLNSKNVLDVYSATGNPNDDGYLTAPEWKRQIQSQLDPVAFTQMYQIFVNRGSNYSTPRQIRLGCSLNF